jgi:hypothetical protein
VRLQVRAGRERVTDTGEDGDSELRIVAKVLPGIAEQKMRFVVDRVLALGAVQGDVGDLTPFLGRSLYGCMM